MKKYKEFLFEKTDNITKEIVNIIKNKTDFKPGDASFLRSDDRQGEYIVDEPRERKSVTSSNIAMNWVDNSERWKDFPKRGKSLTFSKQQTDFGIFSYQVIPFKNVKIAFSSNGDFNWAFTNKYLDEVVSDIYDVGLNDRYGNGYAPSRIIKSLLFDGEIYPENYLEKEIDFKKCCNEIEELINKDVIIMDDFNLPKLIYKDILLKYKIIKLHYKKWYKKFYNNYYEFIDFLLDPELNGFKVLEYKDAVNSKTLHNYAEYWINGKYIMFSYNWSEWINVMELLKNKKYKYIKL